MKSYVIGKDTFAHDFQVEPSSGLLNSARAFSRLLGGWPYFATCLIGLSVLGALVLSILASGPFLQFFYVQLLILGLFTLGLVFVMKGKLEKNVLAAGRYKLESDESQIRIFSTSSGTQRYGLSLIDKIRSSEAGSEIVLKSGFTIPINTLDLALGSIDQQNIPDQTDQGSIWFAEKTEPN